MPPKTQDGSFTRAPRGKLDSFARKNAEAEINTKYESGLIPLLWLLIPFVLILVYGFFS